MRFFGAITKKLEGLINLDPDEVALRLTKQRFLQELVIRLNTEGQLFQGINSKDQTLESIGGGYSPYTIELKKLKGQPTNRVTLKDTGEFYESFKVIPFKGGFTIDANTLKDDTNLINEWGKDILGLNETSLEKIRDEYKEFFIKEAKRVL